MLLPCVLLAQSVGAGAAAAATGEVTPVTSLDAPHSIRRGVAVGLMAGADLGAASGYPNDSTRIGDPNYYSASAWMVGTSETLFVLGSLTDYLSVGFFFTQSQLANRDWRSTGSSGGVRLEVFPLALVVPRLSGLGVEAAFGLGGGNL